MTIGEAAGPGAISWEILRTLPLPIVALDSSGLVTFWNPAAESQFGWREEEVLGRPLPTIPPGREPEHERILDELRRGITHQGIEIQRARKDGSPVFLGLWTAPIRDAHGTLVLTVAAMPDIGTLRQTEELLRVQTHALEAAANGIAIVDRHGMIVWTNKALEVLTGYARGELIGRHTRIFHSGVHGREVYAGLWETVLAGKRWHGVLVNRRKDGSGYNEEMTIAPIRADDGAISHFVAIKQDVTAKLRTEEALRRSEERFRVLTESSPDWIWEVDEHGVYTYASPRVRDLLGYEPPEVIGRTPFDFMPPDEAERIREVFRGHAEAAEPFTAVENRNLHRDGTEVILETSGVPIFDEAGRLRGFRGVDRDITRRKRLEAQLAQAQKMEAIGQLAGGIAHDFNNLLTAIIGYSDLILESTSEEEPWRADLLEIRSAGDRAASLTRQLLAFSRQQPRQLEVVSLDEVVRGVERMLVRILGEHIHLEVKRTGDLPPLLADRSQLEQVILNLAVNARDAMPRGGALTIRMEWLRRESEDPGDERFPAACGDFVRVTVRDTGVGMDEITQSRIFEPFFSTKGDRGTGMGLATVYGIVQQMGGSITVTSRPGEGTAFELVLPAAE